MKKKLVIMSTICALIFALCACGSSKDAANTKEATSSAENTEDAADDTAAAGTLTFDIPEGFVESAENYYSNEDATKLSNINSLALENDGSFDSINSEILIASLETQLKEASGEDLTLSLLEEETYEINGHRAYKYAVEYEILGNTFRQLQCIVETDEELHFITFTDINNEGFYDSFKEAADSIRFE